MYNLHNTLSCPGRLPHWQVKFLEVLDCMIGHILVRLFDAEQQQQQQQYVICVTGDHSTPVVFGDHSHEPVPFAVAKVGGGGAAVCSAVQGLLPCGFEAD
jgi:2,3-bisphosphoglycerate-independent phosphoglycerate mutase